ncbi:MULTISPECIES: glutathione S-transferase family protein [unclassified Sphingobium]|uniref:glutathione S-transferase family protein n=1 Tax=unclassified Sphingobium TaxID=2611147 RepID=UPI0035A6262A
MIDLYFWPTPNGKKVTILLEEASIPYRIKPLNIVMGEQFDESYLALNPNHRMPTMVDNDPLGGGAAISVFESGAILMYLAEKSGQFWPQSTDKKYAVVQWLIWQMANMGPKIGEYNHFNRLGSEQGDQSYALRRFDDEANRLYGVLNYALHKHEFVAGAEYSIADMSVIPWAMNWKAHGQDLDVFPHVRRWLELVLSRPGVQRGLDVGKELTVDPNTFTPEEKERFRRLLFNQRAIPVPGGEFDA